MNGNKAEYAALIWAFLMTLIDFFVYRTEYSLDVKLPAFMLVLTAALILYYVVARIAIGVIRFSTTIIKTVVKGGD